ncbi:MAG: hypothetical protein WAX04_13070 [Oscillospiraceae bacterium]
MKYIIEYGSTNPSKLFNINEMEEIFFRQLYVQLESLKLNNRIKLTRMSNGTLAVNCAGYPVGKVKLQGKKNWMQILKSLCKHDVIEGSLDDFIPKIDEWIHYVKKYLIKEF